MRIIRPQLRFTLRLLLAAVTVLCVALGIWTHRARVQRQLVERIRQSGGDVTYDLQSSVGGVGLGPLHVSSLLIPWLGNDFFHDVSDADVREAKLIRELPRLRNLACLHISGHE